MYHFCSALAEASRASGFPPDTFITGRSPDPLSFFLRKKKESKEKRNILGGNKHIRKRDKQLVIRLTENEKLNILDKVAKSGLPTNEFIIKCTSRAKIKAPIDLKPVVRELKRIGTNLNQLTAKANSGVIRVLDLSDTNKELAEIYKLLNEIYDANS